MYKVCLWKQTVNPSSRLDRIKTTVPSLVMYFQQKNQDCNRLFEMGLQLPLDLKKMTSFVMDSIVELSAAGAIDRADYAYSWPTPGSMDCAVAVVREFTSTVSCAVPALIYSPN